MPGSPESTEVRQARIEQMLATTQRDVKLIMPAVDNIARSLQRLEIAAAADSEKEKHTKESIDDLTARVRSLETEHNKVHGGLRSLVACSALIFGLLYWLFDTTLQTSKLAANTSLTLEAYTKQPDDNRGATQ